MNEKKAIKIYKNAHKRTDAGSVENVVTNKSMSLGRDFNPLIVCQKDSMMDKHQHVFPYV